MSFSHRVSFILLMSLVAPLACGGPAKADLVYDNGVELAQINGAIVSQATFNAFAGDDFTLGASSVINEISWTGSYQNRYFGFEPPVGDDFTIQIFGFSGGVADTAPLFSFSVGNAVNRTDTGVTPGPFQDAFAYHASIPDTTLAAGRYLLSIFNNLPDVRGVADYWDWSTDDLGDGVYFRRDVTQPWGVPDEIRRTDFTLMGPSSVPEPSSVVMLGLGSLGLVGGTLRRRRGA